ncbi:MAG: hypothetical protein ABI560_16235, partial [Myxococcales bacterium]
LAATSDDRLAQAARASLRLLQADQTGDRGRDIPLDAALPLSGELAAVADEAIAIRGGNVDAGALLSALRGPAQDAAWSRPPDI